MQIAHEGFIHLVVMTEYYEDGDSPDVSNYAFQRFDDALAYFKSLTGEVYESELEEGERHLIGVDDVSEYSPESRYARIEDGDGCVTHAFAIEKLPLRTSGAFDSQYDTTSYVDVSVPRRVPSGALDNCNNI